MDFSVFGVVPLEIYIETKEPKYLDMGRPSPTGSGAPHAGRVDQRDPLLDRRHVYDHGPPGAGYRATGDAMYLDRAALEMVAYLDKLQQPNGLFYHAPDVPFYWGRGNGWVAAGMAELLRSLPGRTIPGGRAFSRATGR